MFDAQAQLIGAPTSTILNAQLRSLFDSITPPAPTPSFFYDMSAHFVDSSWFTPKNPDTLTSQTWTVVYDEIWCSQYDTNLLPRVDTLVDQVLRFGEDTVVLALLDLTFSKLKDSALNDTTYFHVDTLSGLPYDNPNASGSAYRIMNVFAGAAFPELTTADEVIFRIDPTFIFIDSIRSYEYDTNGLQLEIDFGDGNGWNNIPHDSLTHHEISYDSSGTHILSFRAVAAPTDSDTVTNQSQSRLAAPAFQTTTPPDEQWEHIDGMLVDVFNPCVVDGQDTAAKYIIFAPGFAGSRGSKNLNGRKRYNRYFKRTGLADLRNHGYHILMISWDNPTDLSENNAMHLVDLIDDLKCEVLSQGDQDREHQFVVIGSSSGALAVTYALSWMEQNPTSSACRPDLMHNTRLFISIDAEFQGAFIPMAFQEFFAMVINNPINLGFDALTRGQMQERLDMLNKPVTRELVTPHYSTRIGNTYPETSERAALLNDFQNLNGNNGYPEFVKMIATTNGLLTGEHQTGIADDCTIEPDDAYFDLQRTRITRIRFNELQESVINLELRATDQGEDFLAFNRTYYEYSLRLNWVVGEQCLPWPLQNVCIPWAIPAGFEMVVDSTITIDRSFEANGIPELDGMPGGWMGAHVTYDNPIQDVNFMGMVPPQFSVVPMLLDTTGPVIGTAGCPLRTLHNPFPNIIGTTTFQSQALRFNFVPLQSAIDYQDNVAFDHNVFNETATTVMANTPFDVIIGEVHGQATFPQAQQNAQWVPSTYTGTGDDLLRYPSLNRVHCTVINHLMPDTFLQNDTNGTLFARYLNREIGDEEMFLDNLDINRPSIFQAEYDLYAGAELNPLYTYPGTPTSAMLRTYTGTGWQFGINDYGYNLNSNGIFSASNAFTVLANADVELISENSPQDVGIVVIGPYPTLTQDTLWVCTNSYSDSLITQNKNGDEFSPNLDPVVKHELLVYPNPISAGSEINFIGLAELDYTMEIRDGQGRVVKSKQRTIEHSRNLYLPNELTPGVYFVVLYHIQTTYTFKIIVQ